MSKLYINKLVKHHLKRLENGLYNSLSDAKFEQLINRICELEKSLMEV